MMMLTASAVSEEGSQGVLPPQVHPFRGALVDGMAGETITETIDALNFIDDRASAQTSMMDFWSDDAHDLMKLVLRLSRVRRLLVEARQGHRDEIVERLRAHLAVIADDIDGHRDDEIHYRESHQKAIRAAEFSSRAEVAPAVVYLLVELQDYTSLPLMDKLCRDQIGERPVFVSLVYVVYGMNELCKTYPRQGLSPEQLTALDAVIAAGKEVRPPREVQGAPWDAPLNETDPRVSLWREEHAVEAYRKQEPMAMRKWEFFFEDSGRMYATPDQFDLSPRAEALLARMDAFVDTLGGVPEGRVEPVRRADGTLVVTGAGTLPPPHPPGEGAEDVSVHMGWRVGR